MDRESLLLLSISMLIAAAVTVGIGGWVLFVRDRRLSETASTVAAAREAHPEAPEER